MAMPCSRKASFGSGLGLHLDEGSNVDRLAGDGNHTIASEMREVQVQGVHKVEVRNKKSEVSEAVLELRYRRIRVLPPINKQKRYPALTLTVLQATERNPPKRPGKDRLEAHHQSACPVSQRGGREAALVCHAVEDRDLPQGTQTQASRPRR